MSNILNERLTNCCEQLKAAQRAYRASGFDMAGRELDLFEVWHDIRRSTDNGDITQTECTKLMNLLRIEALEMQQENQANKPIDVIDIFRERHPDLLLSY